MSQLARGPTNNLFVGLQHDAAALADAMNRDVVARRGLNHGFHRPRPFGRRNLDAVLAAVSEPLVGRRQIVRVAHGKLESRQDGGCFAH